MKLRPLMSFVVASAMAVGLFCLGPSPVAGEESLGEISRITEWGPYKYKLYAYPSKSSAFFMYPHTYVTFDTVNGKYWLIESPKFEYENRNVSGIYQLLPYGVPSAIRPERLKVTFYTPDMKQLAYFPWVRSDHMYSVPRDGNDYERIICKIESDGDYNWDIKMRIWDPVDPVIAEPEARHVDRQ